MSTTMTVDQGQTTVAIRYYGGEKRGGMVLVHAASREEAVARYGSKSVRADGRPVTMRFDRWLKAQEKAGYTLEFKDPKGPCSGQSWGDLDGGIAQSHDHGRRGFVPN